MPSISSPSDISILNYSFPLFAALTPYDLLLLAEPPHQPTLPLRTLPCRARRARWAYSARLIRRLCVCHIRPAQLDRHPRSGRRVMCRRHWRLVIPLIGKSSMRVTMGLRISWLSICRTVVLLQNRAFELRATPKPTESICFAQIGFWRLRLLSNFVNGTVLAARVGRVRPGIRAVGARGCG